MTDNFTSVFGGSPVQPSEVAYRAIMLTESVTLFWPQQTVDTTDIIARWNTVTPAAGSLTITLGPATAISTGQDAAFQNVGSNAFTILANDGSTIASVPASTVIYIINSDNSTAAGSWQVTTFGGTTSQANAASLAGNGLKAIAGLLNFDIPVRPTPTNYSSTAADRATVLNWTGGAGTITLADPAVLTADWIVAIRNSGSGALTLATAAGNINGSATKTYNQGDSSWVVTDGSNFFTVGFGQSVVSQFTRLVVSVAGSSDVALTSAQAVNQVLEFTGVLTGDINVTVPTNVAEYFVYNHTTGAHTLTFKTNSGSGEILTQTVRRIAHSDGTNIVFSDTLGTGTVTNIATGTGLTGGPITSTGTILLANTAVVAGSYTGMNATVDAQGRITAAANGSGGSVSSVTAGAGLIGGTITTSGTIAMPTTGVTAGTYSRANLIIDAFGRITAAASGSGSLLAVQSITSTGTITLNVGTAHCDLIVIGAGGAGGGSNATTSPQVSAGSGGNAGEIRYKFLIAAGSVSGATATIGAAGVGVSASNGGTGGDSSLASVVAAGGVGGVAGGAASSTFLGIAPSGATFGSGGDLASGTFPGSAAIYLGAFAVGGGGASCGDYGSGGTPVVINANGNIAVGRGAGGAGAVNIGTSGAHTGGNGVGGLILIFEYS